MGAQYFAKLDANNIVIHIAVVTAEFMAANLARYPGIWVETFIDSTHTYAGVGYVYDEATQDFYKPKNPNPIPVEL